MNETQVEPKTEEEEALSIRIVLLITENELKACQFTPHFAYRRLAVSPFKT